MAQFGTRLIGGFGGVQDIFPWLLVFRLLLPLLSVVLGWIKRVTSNDQLSDQGIQSTTTGEVNLFFAVIV